jgi:AcrR family transcriptional regulator
LRGVGKEAVLIAEKRTKCLETAYRLFCNKNIESVSLQTIANEAGIPIATLYKYFTNKQTIVIEVASLKWKQFLDGFKERRQSAEFDGMTAAMLYEVYLDAFLDLYRNHRDHLRFNQMFNMYVQGEHIGGAALKPYQGMIENLKARFHNIFLLARKDRTVRTDVSEDEMFSTTLHLMLAAVTRYAVGLVYVPEDGFEPEKELLVLKEALLEKYKAPPAT